MSTMSTTPIYAPPAGPPPSRPSLHSSNSVPYNINLESLAIRGWTPLCVEQSDPLYSAFSQLFSCSAQFFSLPEEAKMAHRKPMHWYESHQASEEGYSHIPGEKSMITLRKVASTPAEFEIKKRAVDAWRASAEVMQGIVNAIEDSLCMQSGVLQRTIGPQGSMPCEGEENVATLLRMFRYERPVPALSTDGNPPTSKVVAEAHKDLGLLSIVVGHTPGLECWDDITKTWIPCEESAAGEMSVTLLVGQTLARFTNWRYNAGRHRVLVHPIVQSQFSTLSPNTTPPSTADLYPLNGHDPRAFSTPEALLADPSYRFSLVHALRAHLPVRVSSSDFATPITGYYPPALQFSDVSIGEIYKAISQAHWNVNIDVPERRRQELQLQAKAAATAARIVDETPEGTEGPGTPARSRSNVECFKDIQARPEGDFCC